MIPLRTDGGIVPRVHPSRLPEETQEALRVLLQASMSRTMCISPLSPAEAGALQQAEGGACFPKVHSLLQ